MASPHHITSIDPFNQGDNHTMSTTDWTTDPTRATHMATVTTERPPPDRPPAVTHADVLRQATTSTELIPTARVEPPAPPAEPDTPPVLVQFWVPGAVADALVAMRHGTVGMAEMDADARAEALAEYYSQVGQLSVQKGLSRWTERLTALARWGRR